MRNSKIVAIALVVGSAALIGLKWWLVRNAKPKHVEVPIEDEDQFLSETECGFLALGEWSELTEADKRRLRRYAKDVRSGKRKDPLFLGYLERPKYTREMIRMHLMEGK